jgi:DNA-binding beta-propeller fold protein YncE
MMLAAALPVAAAVYTTDKSYQYPGQSLSNSGRGIAVNADGSRLFAISRDASTSTVHILDTSSGDAVGVITPVGTAISDVALSPDGTEVFIARRVSSTQGAVDSAPSTGGAAAEIPALATLTAPAVALAVTQDGPDLVLGIATPDGFQVWRRSTDSGWSQVADKALLTSATHTVTVLDTGAEKRFYVLTPSIFVYEAMKAFRLDGTPVSLAWDETPASIGNGYTYISAVGATVGGVPSIFIAGETIDDDLNSRATVFRFGADGKYLNDGFGYDVSTAGTPLAALQPISETAAPLAASPGCLFAQCILQDGDFAGLPQIARVVIDTGTPPPGSIHGTVRTDLPPNVLPLAGASVLQDGVDAAILTDSEGRYDLGDTASGPARVIGVAMPGYAGVSQTVALQAGQTQTVDLTVNRFVAMNRAYQINGTPPVVDGALDSGEYPGTAIPMFQLGAGTRAPAEVATSAWVAWDADALYVAVSAEEPTIAFNAAATVLDDSVTMLTVDDNMQIAIDPPHRHDVPGSGPNLRQFALNIPKPNTTSPKRLDRLVTAAGATAGDIAANGWTSAVGYTTTGWVVEARIPFATLGITPPFSPATDTVWGLLIARHRPQATGSGEGQGHLDGYPEDYCTSPTQANSLLDPRTWTDTVFLSQPPGVAGDVNRNGVLDLQDAALVIRIAAGLPFGESASNYEVERALALLRGDVWPKGAPDGRLSIEDAVRLARAAAGMDSLP